MGRERELYGGEKGAHAQMACARAPCVMPSRPRMLSWQQMASFNVHREELHDLLCSSVGQERNDRLVTGHTSVDSRGVQWKNLRINLFLFGDSGFTEEDEE